MAHEWQTKISRVLEGKVIIHGYSHEQLIGDKSYAEGVFLTLRGELPTPAEARMLDAMLNSLLDHGFVAASVLAARYAASGNPQLVPGTAAGLLTAGSNTISPQHSAEFLDRAVKMMKDEKLSLEETAKRVVAAIRAEKRRIPGLGHPTHKGDDFRAVKLRKIAQECGLVGDKVKMFEAIHAEFVRVTGRQGLCINVDGMLGALMSEMGFRPMQMAAVALLAVLPGIMAHVIEEIEEGKPLRIVRDEDCDYTGKPERPVA
ncbi:MAG: citryl-CoA lyase [Burkholderiales bacterium]|nr:citryl-CoA lyase [Burkholderiales bacterium]